MSTGPLTCHVEPCDAAVSRVITMRRGRMDRPLISPSLSLPFSLLLCFAPSPFFLIPLSSSWPVLNQWTCDIQDGFKTPKNKGRYDSIKLCHEEQQTLPQMLCARFVHTASWNLSGPVIIDLLWRPWHFPIKVWSHALNEVNITLCFIHWPCLKIENVHLLLNMTLFP